MRKADLFRREIARDAPMQELFSELSDTRFALSQAYARFNAVLSRYNYLLRQIKARGGTAEQRTCTEGVATWG